MVIKMVTIDYRMRFAKISTQQPKMQSFVKNQSSFFSQAICSLKTAKWLPSNTGWLTSRLAVQ
jgi:hypothetical protein